ncbi:MAG TPA: isoaspartyl peptidase/L-asparaginase [Thermoanaerobaculia bacterium]|jgi:beta-aspartyl-peptidase (threonine type)|nr:isoaspartyl peptidase/L-asparaginase [Thermoanaerobaculia bacterium]
MPKILSALLLVLLPSVLLSQSPPPAGGKADIVLKRADSPRWAIAIHGGAGVIPKTLPEAEKQQYFKSLESALKVGRDVLAGGGTSLDAVEKVVRFLEDDPLFNAGKGAVYNHEGKHELDAAIMNGRDLACGSVAALTTVKNPITLARLVMEKSQHVFLVGEGAERFADAMKVPRVPNSWFDVERRYQQLQEELKKERGEGPGDPDKKHGTVGAVALDVHGDLAAATSSGGLTNKRYGRIGDVPIIGAGTYADNHTCAISATGFGEQFIRHTVAHDISALMAYRGLTLQQAADLVIHKKLNPGDGGVIGVAHDGSIALVFNSVGMFRGAADAGGRFEVKIWE